MLNEQEIMESLNEVEISFDSIFAINSTIKINNDNYLRE